MKVCKDCSERKSEREFYSNGKGRLRPECMACHRARKRDAYEGDTRRRIQQQVLARYHATRLTQATDSNDVDIQ